MIYKRTVRITEISLVSPKFEKTAKEDKELSVKILLFPMAFTNI